MTARRIPLRIVKCHGSGNDFPLIDARAMSLAEGEWSAIACALSDRAGPVGGDGILLLTAGDGVGDAAHAFGMRMLNADGSEAETCLNGLRCVARAGLAALGADRARVRLATSSAEVARDPELAPGVYTVRERAGPASLDITVWPMRIGRDRNVDQPIGELGSALAFTAVAMPNPHLVAFVDRVDEAELVRVGLACEAAPAWLPNRANVSFVEQRGADLFVRTHERGVGLTDSCGSAMAASTFAACLTGRLPFDRATTVFNKGGRVRASAGEDGLITISGNATWEWAGTVEVDPVTRTAARLVIEERFDHETAAWARAIA